MEFSRFELNHTKKMCVSLSLSYNLFPTISDLVLFNASPLMNEWIYYEKDCSSRYLSVGTLRQSTAC